MLNPFSFPFLHPNIGSWHYIIIFFLCVSYFLDIFILFFLGAVTIIMILSVSYNRSLEEKDEDTLLRTAVTDKNDPKFIIFFLKTFFSKILYIYYLWCPQGRISYISDFFSFIWNLYFVSLLSFLSYISSWIIYFSLDNFFSFFTFLTFL